MTKRIVLWITTALFLGLQGIVFAQNPIKDISLEDIWRSRKFYPAFTGEVRSMNDGEHYCTNENDSIFLYFYKTGEKDKLLVAGNQLIPEGAKDPLSIDEFNFSNDETKMLIATETEPIYRRSSKSLYYVWDFTTQKLAPVSDKGKQRLADLSPDGTKIAFVRDNNLFLKDLLNNTERQITADGLQNSIINGATDWVYEEEFEFSKAFFWSPDGTKIAFYRFDESKVKEFSMTMWGDLYPEEYKFKYPKAGEANSIVNIFVYDITTGSTVKMDIGNITDQYIPRIKWTNIPDVLCIYRMNRLQNKLELLFTNPTTGISKVIYTEENKYYIEINDHLTFLKNNKHFILSSEKDGYRHIYLYDMQGNLVRQLTSGNWEVIDIKGVDESKGIVYYISTETSPLDRNLYAVNLSGKGKKRLSTCNGTFDAEFSRNFKYYVGNYSDANTPPSTTLYRINGRVIKVLNDNAELKKVISEYGFIRQEFFTIKTSEDIELNAYMIKPANFDSTKKYPVLINVYGGPGSQTVQNTWDYFDFVWYQMLAQKGYISVSVDNRGTGARGEAFKKCTYMQMGKYETIDQIDAALFLGTLPYVDKNRIGIWGWSFGGFMTASCLTKGADVFKTGIAVAPVTNWRYYDNIYTERFMRTPQENPSGYDDNSPINYAKNLKGKFLLVHGTCDDNVHVQNSMDLITALVNNNRQFEMQFYPNKNHGIYGGFTRLHLYKRMTDFLLNNL
ncbi:MAG: S9 family peptidase [Lentimicrobiaceae bacterium]|nr:S9 family peptidase [Lentimicrobiaceae bacterium]